ncbi:site-specific integrase [Achromobacter arsenitoxydans]|uniref:site-specific integrase n=1 Tax=Achromobacter arsenitoxydans TaxID=1147684 RepID=UPI001EE67341|nr:site-specific integrase [Achromobacter arsenitoxydans]
MNSTRPKEYSALKEDGCRIRNSSVDTAVRALLREGSSTNTLISYRAAIRYWAAWHRLRFAIELKLPLTLEAVVTFITDHVEHLGPNGLRQGLPEQVDRELVKLGIKKRVGPLALSTVEHRVAVMSEAHLAQHMESPCRVPVVQRLLSRTRRAYVKRGVRPNKVDAITLQPLKQMLETCDDSLLGIRDRALLLFAWSSGGRRRSEVVAATVENTKRRGESYVFILDHSKTNQEGRVDGSSYKPIVGAAAEALTHWLHSAGITQGTLFRQVRRYGILGGPLSTEAVRRIVIERAKRAGLDGRFAAHSLRAGFVTEAGIQGIPMAEIMAMTGHSSVASVVGYHRAGSSLTSAAARLFDDAEMRNEPTS